MKRLLLGALFLSTALLLTACPQTPPPPVNPAQCPVGPLQVQRVDEPSKLRGLGRFEGEFVPGELIVVPKPGLSLQALRAQGVEPEAELARDLIKVKVPPGREKVQAEALLHGGAQYVQPNYVYRSLRVPNDTNYPDQKPYFNGLLRLETAWDFSTGKGCPPLIAVLDTGILPHEDFQASKYLPAGVKLDVADDDVDPTDDSAPSDRGHGLQVASVLGADTNNLRGIAGTTWGGYVVPIKVFSRGGGATYETLFKGVRLARQLGAQVINISLGGDTYDMGLDEELARARGEGRTIVAAAGNYRPPYPPDYSNGGPVMFPASSPSVIAVGAVDLQKQRAEFSAYGPELDLVAPGVGITLAGPSNNYLSGSGTSFASPIVAGVVALYMSRYASEHKAWPTPDQVYACLTGTAEDLGSPGRDDEYGFGLVRADRVMTDTTYCFP
ncbi:S8 family peptidase [Thermus sp.]|uniref:S8 family peptidase n=1 Tax=Thermus sp. TaxID=275 RepID=UPI003D097595